LVKLYIFARKIACGFYPFASASLAPAFLASFAKIASAFFYELDAQTASVLRPQMRKTRFAIKFRLGRAPCRTNIVALRFSALISCRLRVVVSRGKIYKISRIFIASPLF